jgi:hypothetical protein
LAERFNLAFVAGVPAEVMLADSLNDLRRKFAECIVGQGFGQVTGELCAPLGG